MGNLFLNPHGHEEMNIRGISVGDQAILPVNKKSMHIKIMWNQIQNK